MSALGNKPPILGKDGADIALRYRHASLLDAPIIFELMMEGAVSGAFSENFLYRWGSPRLLWMLLKGLLTQSLSSRRLSCSVQWEIVSDPSGNELGFLKTSGVSSDVWNLELLAVKRTFRNRGFGKRVLHDVMSRMPEHAKLVVHCTKYARAMQHILKRRQFRRTHCVLGAYSLEEYVSDRVPL